MKLLVLTALMVSLAAFPLGLSMDAAAGDYSKFQQVIAKQYPGFFILKKNEFEEYIQAKNPEPGRAVGDFDGDGVQDFAAIIRDNKKQRFKTGSATYDRYKGKLVVCEGKRGGSFNCKILEDRLEVGVPHGVAIEKQPPGILDPLDEKPLKAEHDMISESSDRFGTRWVRRPDGSYYSYDESD